MNVTAYLLRLNHMRGACENGRIIAASFDRDKLVDFLQAERVERYVDNSGVEDDYGHVHPYTKFFRKGGPLEWFNDVFDPQGVPDVFGHGIVPQVVEFAREEDRPRIIQDVELHGVMFFV